MKPGVEPWFQASALSTPGRREENQDRETRVSSPWGEIFAVADGMGGHFGGAIAADLITRQLPVRLNAKPTHLPPAEMLDELIRDLHQDIREQQSTDDALRTMGSTIVVLLLTPEGQLWIAHVGDSRGYRFHAGVLERLTRDHTVTQRLLDEGSLSPQQVRSHSQASVLTRALGQADALRPEVRGPLEWRAGDCFLLCSDGLSGSVDDELIADVLKQGGDTLAGLEQIALSHGSMDNITVQFITTAAAPTPTAIPSSYRRAALLVLVAAVFAIAWGLWSRASPVPSSPQLRVSPN
jgi:serine/threonine protein phosphatase PrpC